MYLASTRTHVDHEAWLVDSDESFHMTQGLCWCYAVWEWLGLQILVVRRKGLGNKGWGLNKWFYRDLRL